MRNCSLYSVILLLSLFEVRAAHARDVTYNDGPAVGFAVGSDSNSAAGVVLGYYFTWPEHRLSLMPHAGTGVPLKSYSVAPEGESPFFLGSMLPWSFGAAGSYGRRNRLVVDVHAFSVDHILRLYGERIDQRQTVALGLAVGWELLTASGFFIRANLGPSYAFLPPLYRRSEGFSITGNLISIGAKLW